MASTYKCTPPLSVGKKKNNKPTGGHHPKEERLRYLLCTWNYETTLGASRMEVTLIGQGIGLHHGEGN